MFNTKLLSPSLSILALLCSPLLIDTVHAQAPGGVSTNGVFWLKANEGVTGSPSITSWNDQFASTNNATDNSGTLNGPELIPSANSDFNFHPTVSFNNANSNKLQFVNAAITAGEFIVVTKSPSGFLLGQIRTSSRSNNFMRYFSQSIVRDFGSGTGDYVEYSFSGNNAIPHIRSMPLEEVSLTSNRAFKNGRTMTVTSSGNFSNGQLDPWTDNVFLGAMQYRKGNVSHMSGEIAEAILYSQKVTDAERKRIESYLALKYGITLDQTTAQDYLASDGTHKIWDKDAPGAAAYNNDIVGIGRDDTSALGQIQSKSVNTDAIFTIAAEGEGTNAANAFTDMADLEFLTFGNNNGANTWAINGVHSGFYLLSRQWSVQETGDVGTVQLDVDVADADFDVPDFLIGNHYYFVYDSNNDGNMSDETPIAMSDQGGNIWRASGINLDNGEEFTIATQYEMDFGDAPDLGAGVGANNYETLLANGGPYHQITPNLTIGTAPDADTDGFGNGTDTHGDASDDDTKGTSDEGSIILPSLTNKNTTYNLTGIPITNSSGNNATLLGWIDLDQNGSFDEDERASTTVAHGATTANLTWTSLPGILQGTTYIRIRIAASGNLALGNNGGADEASLGWANSGEVEDYQIIVQSGTIITNRKITYRVKPKN